MSTEIQNNNNNKTPYYIPSQYYTSSNNNLQSEYLSPTNQKNNQYSNSDASLLKNIKSPQNLSPVAQNGQNSFVSQNTQYFSIQSPNQPIQSYIQMRPNDHFASNYSSIQPINNNTTNNNNNMYNSNNQNTQIQQQQTEKKSVNDTPIFSFNLNSERQMQNSYNSQQQQQYEHKFIQQSYQNQPVMSSIESLSSNKGNSKVPQITINIDNEHKIVSSIQNTQNNIENSKPSLNTLNNLNHMGNDKVLNVQSNRVLAEQNNNQSAQPRETYRKTGAKPKNKRIELMVDKLSQVLTDQIENVFYEHEQSVINNSCLNSFYQVTSNNSRNILQSARRDSPARDVDQNKLSQIEEKMNLLIKENNNLKEKLQDKENIDKSGKKENNLESKQLGWTIDNLEKQKMNLNIENQELKVKLQLEKNLKSPASSRAPSHRRLFSQDSSGQKIKSNQELLEKVQSSTNIENQRYIEELLQQIDTLKEKQEGIDSLVKLKSQISELENNYQASQFKIQDLELKNQVLETQLQDLQGDKIDDSSPKSQIEDQQKMMDEFKDQLKELQDQFSVAKTAANDQEQELFQQIEELQNEKSQVEEREKELKEQNEDLTQQVQDVIEQTDQKILEVKANYDIILENEKDSRKQMQEKYEQEVSQLQNEVKDLLQNLDDDQQNIEKINTDDQQLKEQIENQKKEIESLGKMKEEFEQLKENNQTQLEEKINELELQYSKEMNILKEQYSRKLSENMDEDQVEKVKKLEEEKEFQEEFLKDLQMKNKQYQDQIEEFKEQVAKLETQLSDVMTSTINDKRNENEVEPNQPDQEKEEKQEEEIEQEKEEEIDYKKINLDQETTINELKKQVKALGVENQVLKENYENRLEELEGDLQAQQVQQPILTDSALFQKSNKKKLIQSSILSPQGSMRSSISGRSKEETRLMYKKLQQSSMQAAAMMSNKIDYTSLQELTKSEGVQLDEQEISKSLIKEYNERQSLQQVRQSKKGKKALSSKHSRSSRRSKQQIKDQYNQLKKMGAQTAGLLSVKQDYTSLKELISSNDSMRESIKEVNEEIIKDNQVESESQIPETVLEEVHGEDHSPLKKVDNENNNNNKVSIEEEKEETQ